MNRELAEVRRYWPRARVQWTDKTATCFVVPNSWAIVYVGDAVTAIVDTVLSGRVKSSGATIAEAMRAAGFGPRPWGEYASMLKRARTVLRRRGSYVTIVTLDWPPQLADRQRPRKGARLGRRKRSPDGLGKNWRAAARGR